MTSLLIRDPEIRQMADETKRRSLTREVGPLTMRASVVPSTLNEDKRTVEVVWSTGARVLRGFFDRYYEELSMKPAHVRMDRLRNGAPLLDAHNGFTNDGVIGVVESARVSKGEGTAIVRFARAEDDEAADKVFRKVKDGVIRNVSVGYRVHKLEKVEEQDDKIPVYRATDWEPMEISMVPIGADAGASTRAESTDTNPCEFVDSEPQESQMAKTKESTAVSPQLQLDDVATPAAPAARSEDEIRAEAVAAEQHRITGIQRTASTLGLDDKFASEHVKDGTPADKFRELAVNEYGSKDPVVPDAGRITAVPGEDSRDKWLRGAENWLIERAAVGDLLKRAAKNKGETLKIDPGEFRGLTYVDLARAALERAGVRTAGMDKMTLLGKALTFRAGYQATGDFPVLLENVMHKTLLAAYGVTPDTWSLFCAVGSVSDFRPHNRYRMGSFGRLQTVNEGGEFANQALADGTKETISAITKGNIIAMSRQALINDDMGAFSRNATMIGRAARLSIEMDVFDELAKNSGFGPDMEDGNPLFDASHNNLGGGAALSVAALDSDRVVMASQRDPSSNDYLDLRPHVLIVPIGIGGQAKVINDAEFDTDKISNARNREPNKVRGLFNQIVDTPRITGTRRYLFADPAIAPTLEVAFLDGQQSPFLEVKDGWRIDGVEWKVRLDYGVSGVDYRGAVTDAGA